MTFFGPCCYCAKKLHIRQQLNDWLIFYTKYALLCSFTTASGDILETFIYAHKLSIKGPFIYYVSTCGGGGGVRKCQFLLILSTKNNADVGGEEGLKIQKM